MSNTITQEQQDQIIELETELGIISEDIAERRRQYISAWTERNAQNYIDYRLKVQRAKLKAQRKALASGNVPRGTSG